MTNMCICSIFDVKAEAWLNPMFFQAVGQAMRSFTDAINEENSEFNKHPEDYSLFLLGQWDAQLGVLEPLAAPKNLANGINLVTGDLT